VNPCDGIIPTITAVNPSPVQRLAFLTITGTHLDVVQVLVSGEPAIIHSVTPTQLVIIVPEVAVGGSVTVIADASPCGGGSASYPLAVEGTTANTLPTCLIGSAASYGILVGQALTGPAVVVNGALVGLGPSGGTPTGIFTPPVQQTVAEAVALGDLALGRTLLLARTFTTPPTLPTVPGNYAFSSLVLSGVIELTGTAADIYVIHVQGPFSLSAGTKLKTSTGIPACHVIFFAESISIGTGAKVSGTLVAQGALTVAAGVNAKAHLLTQTGPAVFNDTNLTLAPCACGGPLSCIPPPINLVFQCDVSGSIKPFVREYQNMFSAALAVLQNVQTAYSTPVNVAFMTFDTNTDILASVSFQNPLYLNVVTNAAAITSIISGFAGAGFTNWSAWQTSLATTWELFTTSGPGGTSTGSAAACLAQVAIIMGNWAAPTPRLQVLGIGSGVNASNLSAYANEYPGDALVSVEPEWDQVQNTLVDIINGIC
jgi:hypothetical protein